MLGKKKDICNIMIQFLVLEMDYSSVDKNKKKAQNIQTAEIPMFVSIVAKRGN